MKSAATPAAERRSQVLAWTLPPIAVLTATFIALLVSDILPFANLSASLPASLPLLYLTGVLIVASLTGLKPGLATAVLGSLAYNFFFTEPRFTLLVYADADLATLFFFLLMAGLTGNLAAGMRREVERNQSRIQQLSSLNEFGQQMLSAVSRDQVIAILRERLASMHGGPVEILLAGVDREPPQHVPSAVPVEVIDRAWNAGPDESVVISDWMTCPLPSTRGRLGVVAVRRMAVDPGLADLTRSFCHQASLALERVMLSDDLAEARLGSETEQLRSALLSSVSHDLRTPLASIIGSTSSLLEYGDAFSPHDRLELLATVLSEARRLDRHIQNLLDMTRLGQGRISLRREWVDIRDVIAGATARMRGTGEAPPPIDIHVSTDTPMMQIHGALIEQALVNLLDNAVRFSPPGGRITIDVRLAEQKSGEAPEEALTIAVCDEGPGIKPEDRRKVFDMFYTARQGDRGGSHGTGLGLAICRGLVAAHGGTIEAHDGPDGRGTCMRIRLPRSAPGSDT